MVSRNVDQMIERTWGQRERMESKEKNRIFASCAAIAVEKKEERNGMEEKVKGSTSERR